MYYICIIINIVSIISHLIITILIIVIHIHIHVHT